MSIRDQATAAALARVASACDGAVVGVALAICACSSWARYVSASAALARISAAPSLRISDLHSLIGSGSGPESDPLVVVTGNVSAAKRALVADCSGESAVIVEHVQTCLYNQWRGVYGWNFDFLAFFSKTWKERRSTSMKSVPFILVEGTRWRNHGIVHVLLDGSSHPLPLTTVYQHTRPVQATPFTIINAILGIGYPVALLDEEKILPVGKEITAVGICRTRDGTLEFKPCPELPCFLSNMTKDEIVADLGLKTRILFWSGVVLGTLSIGILGYAAFRNWSRWKAWRQRRRQNQVLRDEVQVQSTSDNESEDIPDGELCVICLMRRRRSAFIPCGHRVCCSSCAMHVEREISPKCPLCRQSIGSSIRIYDT